MLWVLNEIFDWAKVILDESALLRKSIDEVLTTTRGERESE
jgi:hypothetical protein